MSMTPDRLRTLYADAVALHRAERLDEAELLFREVAAADPAHAEARHRIGIIAHLQGRWAEAVEEIGAAIGLGADSAGHHFNLALALHELDRYQETAEACRAALRRDPDFLPALYTLGLALKDLGRLEEAIAAYRGVTRRDPDFAEARYGEAYARLLAGDFAQGWPLYEWRRRLFPQRTTYRQPQWSGQDPAGRTLLIHAEQGIGDTIQFARYVPLAAARGARVILEVQPPLVPLLRGLAEQVIGFGDPAPAADFQCPMMSLPLALGGAIPAEVPYLSADPGRWRDRLQGVPGPKIGIAWRGNPQHSEDRRRSMTAETMARRFTGFEGALVCLQKDRTAAEFAAFAGLRLIDAAPELGDFAETAALVAALDGVVSVDTAVAHLAGALGVPGRVLLGFAPDWRWRLGRDDSEWYPSLRLSRQQKPGDWGTIRQEGEESWV
jgi:tetratricopeptide (TPR) repeat protein